MVRLLRGAWVEPPASSAATSTSTLVARRALVGPLLASPLRPEAAMRTSAGRLTGLDQLMGAVPSARPPGSLQNGHRVPEAGEDRGGGRQGQHLGQPGDAGLRGSLRAGQGVRRLQVRPAGPRRRGETTGRPPGAPPGGGSAGEADGARLARGSKSKVAVRMPSRVSTTIMLISRQRSRIWTGGWPRSSAKHWTTAAA